MPITLHPAWHPIMAHFAVGFSMGASLLVMVGLAAILFNNNGFAKRLTYPLSIMLLLSLISLAITGASAMIDFPAATFAASPWFKFKTTFEILAFFVYMGMYYTVLLKNEGLWEDKTSLTYMIVLAAIGAFTISVLGAAGGYLAVGHSVLEPLLEMLGLPMPRA